ncbi:MAG: GNAT family N-acetyltransferase [Xanthomonadales bacterium]|nr:GNAT family N-acetyltransferase [Xanthomonadales bacterium]
MTADPDISFYVEPATWDFDRPELESIRTEVFIQEQGVSADEEWDEDDPLAVHFLARTSDGAGIGTARLTRDGRVGRLAVLPGWRGRGVGDALLRTVIETGKSHQFVELRLAAQTQAVEFYSRHGFAPYGKVFEEAGISHRWMRMHLGPSEEREDSRVRRESGSPLEKSFIDFDGLNELTARMRQVIDYCSNMLVIYSRDLDRRVLDASPVYDAIRELATAAPRPDIRILVQDSTAAVESGHRLINLAHRLPSVIHFRKPPKVHMDYVSAFAISDVSHVLFRPMGDRFEGYLQVNHRLEAKRLMEYFTRVWEESEPDPNLRRLDL